MQSRLANQPTNGNNFQNHHEDTGGLRTNLLSDKMSSGAANESDAQDNQELSLGGPWGGRWLLITPDERKPPSITWKSFLPCAALFYQCITLNDGVDIDDNEVCCKQVHSILSLLPWTAAAVT